MKNYYDLKKDEQDNLQKEFNGKYGTFKKFSLVVFPVMIAFFLWLFITDPEIEEGNYAFAGLCIFIIVYSIVLYFLADRDFKEWLKIKKITK